MAVMAAQGTPEQRHQTLARMALDRAIHEQVNETNPDAFEVRPPWPGADVGVWGSRREPLALPAIGAARRLMLTAQKAEWDAIAHARGQGKTWTEIARALGEPFVKAAKRAEMPLAEAAWRYATYQVMPDQEIPPGRGYRTEGATWRCWTCTQPILETHPDNGPDAEEGHAAGCARLAARRRRGWR